MPQVQREKFSHSAEEPQISNDEQHNNVSFPEVPTHIAVHLPVLTMSNTTPAEQSFTEDSVVFVIPYAKSTSSWSRQSLLSSRPLDSRIVWNYNMYMGWSIPYGFRLECSSEIITPLPMLNTDYVSQVNQRNWPHTQTTIVTHPLPTFPCSPAGRARERG